MLTNQERLLRVISHTSALALFIGEENGKDDTRGEILLAIREIRSQLDEVERCFTTEEA